jgi:hypothetical protein
VLQSRMQRNAPPAGGLLGQLYRASRRELIAVPSGANISVRRKVLRFIEPYVPLLSVHASGGSCLIHATIGVVGLSFLCGHLI